MTTAESPSLLVMARFASEQSVGVFHRLYNTDDSDVASAFYREVIQPMRAAGGERGVSLLAYASSELAYIATRFISDETGQTVQEVLDRYALAHAWQGRTTPLT